jgi:hypothetical protein
MSGTSQHNAIYFPEGAGYLLVKVLQTKLDSYDIKRDVILVRSLGDNKVYVRKIVEQYVLNTATGATCVVYSRRMPQRKVFRYPKA